MRKVTIFFFLLHLSLKAFCTEQVPDILFYNNRTLDLSTGWGHPSPLETYYYQNRIPSPFEMISTANYRGHLATWVIVNERFYLKEISVRDKTYSPGKYKIISKNETENGDSLVFADWFTGIIQCFQNDDKKNWNKIKTFYFQIREGKVISSAELAGEDYKKIYEIPDNDTGNSELMMKYKLNRLNQNYITYYYRLSQNDEINYRGQKSFLNTGVSRLSPIYGLYSNQHLKWPFNWENLHKCGAPHCNWRIINDSLMLESVELYSGLRFDSIDKEEIKLDSLISTAKDNHEIFADWVTGVQLIIYGIDTVYGLGFKQFEPKEYTYCRFEKGILKEAYSIPSDFDMKANKQSLDPRLKKLMEEY